MLDAYSLSQAITAGNDIPLNVKKLETGKTVTLNGSTINLNVPGIYNVEVHATGSTTENGTFGIQLYTKGQPIERTLALAGTATGVKTSLSIKTLLAVANTNYGTSNFTIRNIGSSGTVDVVEVVVTKIR